MNSGYGTAIPPDRIAPPQLGPGGAWFDPATGQPVILAGNAAASPATEPGNGGNGGSSAMIDYSTEEQATGNHWIDGKPVYQKTIVETLDNSGYLQVTTGANAAVIIGALVLVGSFDSGGMNTIPNIWMGQSTLANTVMSGTLLITSNDLQFPYNATQMHGQTLIVTIQYTKAT